MRPSTWTFLTALLSLSNAQTHGEGAEGSEMGPVAFMWPPDRIWDAAHDNTAPCGSPEGPSNRTIFPLSQGSVALNIADDAYYVAFRLATGNNPTRMEDFGRQVVHNITDIDPGHQCYKLDNRQLDGIAAGTNATIQLEYWAEFEGENNGKNQSFFACADITFVEAQNFNLQIPCFNVTSEEFEPPKPSTTSLVGPAPSRGNDGLSAGAKAGIAVGSILGGLAVFAAVGFLLWRRGRLQGLKGKTAYELRAKNLETPEPPEQRA